MKVYIDVYFCLNFLMDFIVLWMTGYALLNNKKKYRITLAASVGAAYAVGILVLEVSGILSRIVTYFVVAEVMIWISFGFKGVKNNFKQVGMLYLMTFLISGALNMLYYGSQFTKSIIEMALDCHLGTMSIPFILCVLLAIISIFSAVWDGIRKNAGMCKHLFPVLLKVNGKEFEVKGLLDTGNALYEPITGKPVSVIEERCIKKLEKENLKILMVPYHTVGCKHGLMQAFVADSIIVDQREIKGALVGIHMGKLSNGRKYDIILHPDIM